MKLKLAMNKRLFETANLFTEVAKDKRISQFMAQKTKEDKERNVVQIKEIVDAFPNLESQISQSSLMDEDCDFEYNGHYYKIGFHSPNAATSNVEKRPIIAVGFDIEDDDETGEADIIFGW